MGDLIRFPTQLHRVPDPEHADRQQNMALAMQLGLIPVRAREPGYVPLLGRLNDETKMQLEDGE